MLSPTPIYFEGSRYVLLTKTGARSQELGRVLPRGEAIGLLARMIGAGSPELRSLYTEVTDVHLTPTASNTVVLKGLERSLSDSFGMRSLVVVEVASFAVRAQKEVQPSEEQKDARLIDSAIAGLGTNDIAHRGSSYRLVRVAKVGDMSNRQLYETLSTRESLMLLAEMAKEPLRTEAQKTSLTQLAQMAEQQQRSQGNQLLLLRRQRTYVTGPEPEVITPSKLRKPKKYNVDLLLVDEWGNPTRNTFTYQLNMSDGAQFPGSFDSAGKAQHTDLDASAGKVTLKKTHPDEWIVRAAQPVGYLRKGFAMSLVDAHGVPIGKYAFEATFDNGATLQGSLDDKGAGQLADTPSYPLTLKIPTFDAEDWAR